MTRISIGSATDLGRRDCNEDSLLAVMAQDSAPKDGIAQSLGSSALLILADGMGGRSNGQVASQTAVRVVYRELAHILAMRSDSRREYLERALHNALKAANTRIKSLGSESPDGIGMGTTCTVAIVTRGMICVAHVGDSRAYVLDSHGLTLMTEDHSVVGDEVRAGRLTEAEARKSRFRNVITRAVGVDPYIVPDIVSRGLVPGEVSHLMVCSDGLHGALTKAEIERIVRVHHEPQDAADALVGSAMAAGASDNISVIVARVEAEQEAADTEFGADAGPQRAARRRRRSLLTAGNLIAFAAGLAIASIIAVLETPYLGSVRQIETGATMVRPAKPAPPRPIDLATLAYGAPQQLLGRPIAPGLLLGAGQDEIIVADPAAHRLLGVNTATGQVATSTPDLSNMAGMPVRAQYWAADKQGDLYESQTSPPVVRKFDRDGRFLRTIAQGELKAPTAIAVDDEGDVLVIDNSRLERIPAKPAVQPGVKSVGAPAATATSAGNT